jgi:hypothetical protein
MGAGNVETSCSSSVLNSIRLSFFGLYALYRHIFAARYSSLIVLGLVKIGESLRNFIVFRLPMLSRRRWFPHRCRHQPPLRRQLARASRPRSRSASGPCSPG